MHIEEIRIFIKMNRDYGPIAGITNLFNDRPAYGLPKCGLRTLVISDFFHTTLKTSIQQCEGDGYIFIEQVDEDLE